MPHVFSTFKRVMVGKPLASSELGHQRLGKLVGLAVFSSDAVASTAFASEEILQVLVPAIGAAAIRSILAVKHGEAPNGLINPEVLERDGFRRKRDAMLERLERE